MTRFSYFIYSLCIILFSVEVYSQIPEKTPAKYMKEADEFMRVEDWESALAIYIKLLTQLPEDGLLNYKIGVCYSKSFQKDEAKFYFEKSLEILGEKNIEPEGFNYMARIYHLTYNFDKAIEFYTKYLSTLTEKDSKKEIVKKELQYCVNAKELMLKKQNVKIENLGPVINSNFPDYAPVISADEAVLIFTSRRDDTKGEGRDPEDNLFFEDIYISNKYNESWTPPVKISDNINTDSHDASVGLSADGQTLFIYRDINKGDLFSTRLIGSEWMEPAPLGKTINTKYWEPSITISGDGNIIYFASDMPGGFGGKDLYMSRQLPGTFGYGKPLNLGKSINTPEDEDGPFIHPDGKTLYFSSKGHYSMGGYDIFKTELDSNRNWSEPENLNPPINTPEDDIYFVLSADGKHGYYASAKPGGFGDKDIYCIQMPEKEKPKPVIVLKGFLTDKENGKPVGAKIIVRDNESSEIISITDANSVTGQYLVVLTPGRNYGITVDNPSYLFHSENVDIPNLDSFDVLYKNIKLQKVSVGTQIVLRNIFFDTGKSELRKQSKSELERVFNFLKQKAEINVEIAGHTDNVGTDENNQILSENRAQAVVDYLIKAGISPTRLQARGYGESQPIESNETNEGRQQNRRTVMEILK
ncbi:MAG: hypothetical protein A3H98_02530 [Bacteroidetes bacterium RIFCSPLOWO2_02_FULL_36_8]|nr:MAG: hypothetical protein A3H98_02530 [Bacteroidetes bacterium RIFCSPLOWO2_02_FULL_36_8]